jgi:mycothiol synthase
MAVEIRSYQPADLPALTALIHHASLADDLEALQGPHGVEAWLADPFNDLALLELAFENGEAAGFAGVLALRGPRGGFALVRLGVLDRFRRRGLGSRLLQRALEGIDRRHPDVIEVFGTFWSPNATAAAFAAAHGHRHVRNFWLMERPRGAIAEPQWPPGIRLESHDGSERQYGDLAATYNDSFAHHYHFAPASPAEMRAFYERPGERTDGLVLAYRGHSCVGFCRSELHAARGEVAVLGTTHAARGIGLGRALLRWGVQWLERENPGHVTLVVDGENENAQRLYRSEGFDVARTRVTWARDRVPTGVRAAGRDASEAATSRET